MQPRTMSYLFTLFTILATLLQLASTSVVLRIRLSNGLMQRLELDEQVETMVSIKERLRKDGSISTDDTHFTLKGKSYSVLAVSASLEDENISIDKLGISSGDILTLARPVVVKERQQIVPSDRSSGANSSGKVAQNIVTRKSQKKPTSIADLEKKRKELLKITRQKVTNGSTVRMTSSAGRILQRMANVGGFAMLMGRVVKTAPAKVPAKKGTSIAEIAKSESAAKSVTEVLAVCEIFQYSDSEEGSDINKSQPQNLCDLPAVAVFVQLAKALGLGVVGCCIGVPSHSLGKEGKPVMWSSDHVFASLQLRSAVDGTKEEKDEFVVISVCKAVSTEDASEAGLSGKKKILRKAKPLVADGISLEAFKLSDQANILYEKGILPLVKQRSERPATTSSSFSSFSSKTNVMKSIAQKALNKGGGKGEEKGEEDHVDKIELDGEVLIQSTEVTSVDPFLFAVPLPIQSLNNKSAKKAAGDAKRKTIQPTAKTSAGDSATVTAEDEGFEHSFPSECEMLNNENTAKVAKLHFNQILLGISNPGTKSRMKDPHLLQYISKMLDANTRDALCRSLSDGTDRFPGLVQVALDMVKMSLDTSRSDSSNSVGRRSGRFIPDDDDDDDDE